MLILTIPISTHCKYIIILMLSYIMIIVVLSMVLVLWLSLCSTYADISHVSLCVGPKPITLSNPPLLLFINANSNSSNIYILLNTNHIDFTLL
jgi:hypothetical protein